MKVYVVIELPKQETPRINGVFSTRAKAEKVAYQDDLVWRNIVEMNLNEIAISS